MFGTALIHFCTVSVAYPFINAFVFFIVFGLILKQSPMGVDIESVAFSSKSALLAGMIGTLFCLVATIPAAIMQIVVVLRLESGTIIRSFLWMTSIALGISLGIGISLNHFKGYFIVLPIQGLISGALLSMFLLTLWEDKIK